MRTARFAMIFTDHEKMALQQLAEAEGGLSQAALLRRLLRQAAKERGLWPPPEAGQGRRQKEVNGHAQ